MIDYSQTKFVHVYIGTEFIKHLDKYHPLSPSLKDKEQPIPLQVSYLFLYLFINSIAFMLCLVLILFLNFLLLPFISFAGFDNPGNI